jgi:hypothetical protein
VHPGQIERVYDPHHIIHVVPDAERTGSTGAAMPAQIQREGGPRWIQSVYDRAPLVAGAIDAVNAEPANVGPGLD